MAEGGSYTNLNKLNEIQKTLEDSSYNLINKSAESTRFYRETKQQVSLLSDNEKAAIVDKADMIIDAACELRKSVDSVEKQAADLKMLALKELADVSKREHTGRKYPRDSGYNSADSACIRESEARQPSADIQECGHSVADTAQMSVSSVVLSENSVSEC